MATIKAGQKVLVTIHPKDQHGNLALVDGIPVWTPADTMLASVEVASDGMSAVFTSLGPVGAFIAEVTVDTDLSEGVRTLKGSETITVIAGEATDLGLHADAIMLFAKPVIQPVIDTTISSEPTADSVTAQSQPADTIAIPDAGTSSDYADNAGRGLTSPMFHLDEAAVQPDSGLPPADAGDPTVYADAVDPNPMQVDPNVPPADAGSPSDGIQSSDVTDLSPQTTVETTTEQPQSPAIDPQQPTTVDTISVPDTVQSQAVDSGVSDQGQLPVDVTEQLTEDTINVSPQAVEATVQATASTSDALTQVVVDQAVVDSSQQPAVSETPTTDDGLSQVTETVSSDVPLQPTVTDADEQIVDTTATSNPTVQPEVVDSTPQPIIGTVDDMATKGLADSPDVPYNSN